MQPVQDSPLEFREKDENQSGEGGMEYSHFLSMNPVKLKRQVNCLMLIFLCDNMFLVQWIQF